MADKICLRVGARLIDRIAHAGPRPEVDDPRNVLAFESPEREAVRNVELGKAKTILGQTIEGGETGQFQADQA